MLVGVTALVAVLAFLFLSAIPGLFFIAAFADWRNLDCLRFPDAGNCSDAVGTLLVAGGMMAVIGICVAFVARWLMRRAAAEDVT